MDINHRLLTLEEQLELGRRIQCGDSEALATLVEGNIRLVHKIATKFYADDPAMAYDDLVQVGLIGLLTAARKYQPERGLRFSTYAVWWIRQAISRAALTSGAIPRSANPNYQHQRPKSAQIQALRQQPVISLDAPLRDRRGDDSENTLADITASAGPSVEEQALSNVEFGRLLDALRLNERGKAVIRAWLSGLSREEAGKMYGVSRSWVYSIIDSRKERLMPPQSSRTCIEPGCNEPRMVTQKGTMLTRCQAHQREYWNEAARIRREKEAGRASADMPRVRPAVQPPIQPEAAPEKSVAADHCTETDCDSCVYHQAFELIAQRMPEARQLLEALQTLEKWHQSRDSQTD